MMEANSMVVIVTIANSIGEDFLVNDKIFYYVTTMNNSELFSGNSIGETLLIGFIHIVEYVIITLVEY